MAWVMTKYFFCKNMLLWPRKKRKEPPLVWGPFCSLKGKRHKKPFAKTKLGKARRSEKRFKSAQREEMMA